MKLRFFKNILFVLLITVSFTHCSKQPYYDIPTDENGNVVITDVATTTTDGITSLDDQFTVSAKLPNAKSGDVFTVELLQLQTPASGGDEQLLPMSGTQKQVTLGADLTATVTYTRSEANLVEVGDYVTVTFAGKTDAATVRIDMTQATSVSGTQYNEQDVNVIRGAGTTYMTVEVEPASYAYSGTVDVKRKNGANEAWVDMGSFSAPASIPVSGDDFATGKDTMYYSITTSNGSYQDVIEKQIVVNSSSFFTKRTGTLSFTDASKAGLNFLSGENVVEASANAVVTINSSLHITAGTNWATGGKTISFVPSSVATYNLNNAETAMSAFASGTPVSTINPAEGEGVYIFKMVNGSDASDIIYGMINVSKITPGESVEFEYRIGNVYEHLAILE